MRCIANGRLVEPWKRLDLQGVCHQAVAENTHDEQMKPRQCMNHRRHGIYYTSLIVTGVQEGVAINIVKPQSRSRSQHCRRGYFTDLGK